ncbi:MAG: hypothetical protein DIJKHBIC_02961 [Thermoanaerobaculia bacterium]|nr:hypothetical protein [Thermoanaerobaculia bacterium]
MPPGDGREQPDRRGDEPRPRHHQFEEHRGAIVRLLLDLRDLTVTCSARNATQASGGVEMFQGIATCALGYTRLVVRAISSNDRWPPSRSESRDKGSPNAACTAADRMAFSGRSGLYVLYRTRLRNSVTGVRKSASVCKISGTLQIARVRQIPAVSKSGQGGLHRRGARMGRPLGSAPTLSADSAKRRVGSAAGRPLWAISRPSMLRAR